MTSKEYLEKYLKIMSKFSASTIRSREYRPLGYGRFYLEESRNDNELGLTVLYKQPGYKDHTIIRNKWHVYDLEYIEEFYAQFLQNTLLAFVALKKGEFKLNDETRIKIYTVADLINKGLPDEDKLILEDNEGK